VYRDSESYGKVNSKYYIMVQYLIFKDCWVRLMQWNIYWVWKRRYKMIGTKVIIEHKYEIGEIFELKNENNDKSIF